MIWQFFGLIQLYEQKVTELLSPQVLCLSITNRILSWFDSFTAYYNCMKENSQNSYLGEFCAQVSQNVFLADLTVFRLNTTVWRKMSQNSYLCQFFAQVSQNVFLADFTVLRLNITVWAKRSQNSYLHELCAQISQIVFLADLTVLRPITTVWKKVSQNSYLR